MELGVEKIKKEKLRMDRPMEYPVNRGDIVAFNFILKLVQRNVFGWGDDESFCSYYQVAWYSSKSKYIILFMVLMKYLI
jgi:hypothetical protein